MPHVFETGSSVLHFSIDESGRDVRVASDGEGERSAPEENAGESSSTPWHVQPSEIILDLFGVDPRSGLDLTEAAKRLSSFGANRIRETEKQSPFQILVNQFRDFTVWILIGAAAIAGFIGEFRDIVIILAIVFLNGTLGFVQEFWAEKAITALKSLSVPHSTVIRGGIRMDVHSRDLVPGDIVLVEAGNKIPADLRLIETARFSVDESALTGESHTVEKTVNPLKEPDLFLGDRSNMAYSGTLVTNGRATGVVVSTGMDTELGRIAQLLCVSNDTRTPLELRLTRFGKQISLGILVLCAIFFFIGIYRHEKPVPMLLTALSLAVAAIPEALPAVIKITLALGARKMVRKHVLVRRLSAVETLGSVTTICTDKTGTLTQNKMRVESLVPAGEASRGDPGEIRTLLLESMALNNDAVESCGGSFRGDPTEVALLVAAQEAGFPKDILETKNPRLYEIPFSSDRALMSTIHDRSGKLFLFSKGAPERILDACFQGGPGQEAASAQDKVLLRVRRMAEDGFRVLAFAYSDEPDTIRTVLSSEREQGLKLLGLVALDDPPRSEAAAAVRLCRSAGIRVVMITGDHPETARAIANRLGILQPGEDALITGRELERLGMKEYETRVRNIRVYARVSPEQKVKIVTALKDQGEFVSMTGDGVNDAPALHRADIGVSMGLSGTEVAREAADMILLDDNFASIVSAVREGRRIYDNIKKFVKYVLTGNAGELLALFVPPMLGFPLPLLPIHILWVNLVTDGLPGIALAGEPEEKDVMLHPPRPRAEGLFTHVIVLHILIVGILIGGVTIFSQSWSLRSGSTHGQSLAFTVLTLSQMAHILAIRTERETVFGRQFFENRFLIGTVVLTGLFQLAILYVPALNQIFRTQPLTGTELAVSFFLSFLVFVAVEAEKAILRHMSFFSPETVPPGRSRNDSD
jgi:Ca2+-transporting ATPase